MNTVSGLPILRMCHAGMSVLRRDWPLESKRSGLEALLHTSCVTLGKTSDLSHLPDFKQNMATIFDLLKMW